MKNIKKASIVPSITIINSEEKIILECGDLIRIITDKSEYDQDYEGEIKFLNEDCIKLESSNHIDWDYILEIEILNKN